jgi:hypothetical protein
LIFHYGAVCGELLKVTRKYVPTFMVNFKVSYHESVYVMYLDVFTLYLSSPVDLERDGGSRTHLRECAFISMRNYAKRNMKENL